MKWHRQGGHAIRYSSYNFEHELRPYFYPSGPSYMTKTKQWFHNISVASMHRCKVQDYSNFNHNLDRNFKTSPYCYKVIFIDICKYLDVLMKQKTLPSTTPSISIWYSKVKYMSRYCSTNDRIHNLNIISSQCILHTDYNWNAKNSYSFHIQERNKVYTWITEETRLVLWISGIPSVDNSLT